ncbi:restriction endonuclease subunit S [Enterococcus raffinosus]|nr:restriction endonuclease subunit S [Enterococcus raffinosus]MDT2590037.1 restriction endonuclease subunit S [Enterococcus raffinosus]
MPESWEWVRFSEVSTIVRGGSPRPIKEFITEADDGINWIKIGDTDKGGKFINSTKEKIKSSGLKKTRYVTKGTFLLTNSMSFGRPYILNVDGAIHDGWLAISNYEEVFSRDFLYYLLSSKVAYHQFLALISGAVVKNLNSDKVASLLVPVPPQKEQERIVSAIMVGLPKVDDYQKLHDRLEKINKELPEKLRKSILQYAMQGKLVPQDPNDEPVEVLLEKIRQEKQKLFEEGKLKKKDLQESIIYKGDDNSYYEKLGKIEAKIEVPFDLPNNYVWKRIRDIYYNDGQTKPRNTFKYIDTGTIDNKSHQLLMGNIRKISATQAPSRARKKVSVNSVLFSSVRPYLTNAAIFEEDNPDDYIASTAFVVMNPILVSSQYLLSVLISPFMIEEMNKKSTGSNYPAINDTNFNTLLVPVTSKSVQDQMVTRLFEFDKYISQIG